MFFLFIYINTKENDLYWIGWIEKNKKKSRENEKLFLIEIDSSISDQPNKGFVRPFFPFTLALYCDSWHVDTIPKLLSHAT